MIRGYPTNRNLINTIRIHVELLGQLIKSFSSLDQFNHTLRASFLRIYD